MTLFRPTKQFLKLFFIVPSIGPATATPGPRDVRLVGSPDKWQGRIEILHNGIWGIICDDVNEKSIGTVVCRQLGYSDAVVMYTNSAFGKINSTIWLHHVHCKGTESRLTDCRHSQWGEHDYYCDRYDANLGVACVHSSARELITKWTISAIRRPSW